MSGQSPTSPIDNLRTIMKDGSLAAYVLHDCHALYGLLSESLQVGVVPDGDRTSFLERTIRETGAFEQNSAIEMIRNNPIDVPVEGFLAAGGAELIGIHDDAIFNEMLERRKIDIYTGKTSQRGISRGGITQRRQYASAWLKERDNPDPAAAGPKRGEPKLLNAFLAALITYVRGNRDDLRDKLQSNTHTVHTPNVVYPTDPSSDYVRRDTYHEQFKGLMDSGANCIAVVGLPGIGKTQLVDAVIREYLATEGPVPVLRWKKGRLAIQDIQFALSATDSNTYMRIAEEEPERYLVEILCGDRAPDFVFFDNLESFREIDAILPAQTKSRIIVTCNSLNYTTRNVEVIRVEGMNDEEAVELIHHKLPGLEADEARLLANSLGGFPILIRLACDLLEFQPASIGVFSDEIRTEAAELAKTGYTNAGEDKTLLAMLQRLLQFVQKESALAYELLTCVVFIDQSPAVDLLFAMEYLRHLFGRRILQTEVLRAFDIFRRYSVLHVSQDEITFTHPSGNVDKFSATWLHMHNLMQSLLQFLLAARKNEFETTALRVTEGVLDEIRGLYSKYGLKREVKRDHFTADENATNKSGHYEQWYTASVHHITVHAEASVLDIVEKTKAQPDLRMGMINVIVFRPGLPVTVVDLDQEIRPTTGVEVELYGYRFNLLVAMTPRGYSLFDAANRTHNPPVSATISRRRIWDHNHTRTIVMPCSSILFLDDIPLKFGVPVSIQKPREEVTSMVMQVGALGAALHIY